MDVYVYDDNLDLVGIVDEYKSLIWANRYFDLGDGELYVPATAYNLSILRKGFYLAKVGSMMVCQIRKIELDTDAENGNYLIITGVDAKALLDQRIIWTTQTANGNAEAFMRKLVDISLITTTNSRRKMLKRDGTALLALGEAQGFTEELDEQVTYTNLGVKMREYCRKFGWGYNVIYNNGKFIFGLYKGQNKANSVVFSDDYENLAETVYIEDDTNIGNVALVAGEGQGSARARQFVGVYSGVNRYEIFVDAKDISRTITYADLVEAYPDGEVVTSAGVHYYVVDGEEIATVPSNSPEPNDNVTLTDVAYLQYLVSRGYDKLAEYGAVKSFEGTIEPNTTFKYGVDYNLGDIVTVQNDFGITVQARITEVIEVYDDTGYSLQPKFEYITED